MLSRVQLERLRLRRRAGNKQPPVANSTVEAPLPAKHPDEQPQGRLRQHPIAAAIGLLRKKASNAASMIAD
jgi:hypothetical protein